ncbi:response regulator [Methylocapsa palsarum]|uniref:Response regulator receiver domain-containing protein n=1 Tax=Methylocapsa palsarum TaxID=1612308 RepID=A0A1I4BJD3_9HYPH|nr:response regulator [Methylocapsa palsarum]SFK68972.1 Response regulator receiver domain-containing protein [Methylocapsa palsarum]
MPDKRVVLVVEDDPVIKDLLAHELELSGYFVVTAINGEDAAQILPATPRIDLLVTDIRMPGRIDGWTLARLAREKSPQLPVIYTSGYSPLQGMEVENSVFLRKPYRTSDILKSIDQVMGPDQGH